MTRKEKIELLQAVEGGRTVEECTAGTSVWILSNGMYKCKDRQLTEAEFEQYEAKHPYEQILVVQIVPPLPFDE